MGSIMKLSVFTLHLITILGKDVSTARGTIALNILCIGLRLLVKLSCVA